MKETLRFVTLYPKCHNPGLMKDVGQIPNTLGNNYANINTKLVSCIVDFDDDNIQHLTGMKIENIPYLLNNDTITGLVYILKNAKRVDWFNFYHGGRKVYYWTKLYKLLNPKGKVYLKMDLGYEGCEKYGNCKKETVIFEKTANIVDIISVESDVIRNKIKEFSNADVKLISNGYFDNGNIAINSTSCRAKEFITVGRLGTAPKATELLLEAFALSANKHNWNLKLVGPVEETFKPYKQKFFNSHPDMRARVFFMGPVFDKNKLYSLYNSARVFVLPSRWEGFPLVGPEAAHCGCRMILTDIIPPFKELTNNGKYGISIKTNDIDAIYNALISEAYRDTPDEEPLNISIYAKNKLSWEEICNKLYEMMINQQGEV